MSNEYELPPEIRAAQEMAADAKHAPEASRHLDEVASAMRDSDISARPAGGAVPLHHQHGVADAISAHRAVASLLGGPATIAGRGVIDRLSREAAGVHRLVDQVSAAHSTVEQLQSMAQKPPVAFMPPAEPKMLQLATAAGWADR